MPGVIFKRVSKRQGRNFILIKRSYTLPVLLNTCARKATDIAKKRYCKRILQISRFFFFQILSFLLVLSNFPKFIIHEDWYYLTKEGRERRPARVRSPSRIRTSVWHTTSSTSFTRSGLHFFHGAFPPPRSARPRPR